jgi:hypothetical protein
VKTEQVAMKNQLTRERAAKVAPIGRPHWQVSLKASVQRGRKRLKAALYAALSRFCASCQPQALGRVASFSR